MVQDESNSLILPEEWQEKFLIKRIDEENIEITLAQRNEILESLSKGDRFIQIGNCDYIACFEQHDSQEIFGQRTVLR